jgi:hypothetical protein
VLSETTTPRRAGCAAMPAQHRQPDRLAPQRAPAAGAAA